MTLLQRIEERNTDKLQEVAGVLKTASKSDGFFAVKCGSRRRFKTWAWRLLGLLSRHLFKEFFPVLIAIVVSLIVKGEALVGRHPAYSAFAVGITMVLPPTAEKEKPRTEVRGFNL